VSGQATAAARRSDYVFAFRDDEELGPRVLARIAQRLGLNPQDLHPRPDHSDVLRGIAATAAT
jgi:hypothetical protein